MMSPAIPSNKHGVALCCILIGLLLLPWILAHIGLPPRETVYTGMRIAAGPAPHVWRQIFVEKEPVDILFVGSSLLVRGVDTERVQEALGRKLGRPVVCRYIAYKWQGLDMQYMLLRDFLSRRQARLVVMTVPDASFKTDAPHVQAFRWMRYGDFPESTAGLDTSHRLAIYGLEVLGAPRQALDYVRHDTPFAYSQESERLGTQFETAHKGYNGDPYVPENAAPPQIAAGEMIAWNREGGSFTYQNKPLRPYHGYWSREIGKLLESRQIPLAVLHIPQDSEIGMSTVPERTYWADQFGIPTPIIGVASKRLFQGMAEDRVRHYYYDQHLNDNGRDYFTGGVMPALIEVYAQSVR